MATHETLAALFTDTADAIREKTGDTAAIVADNFPDAIRALSIPKQFSDVITNGDTLQVTGTYADTIYFKTLTPVKALGTNGEVILILTPAHNMSSNLYIDITFSLPSGATGYRTYTPKPGISECPHAVYITGLTGKYTMTLKATAYSSPRIALSVTVTAV